MFHGMNKLNLAVCWKYRTPTLSRPPCWTNL